MRLGQKSRVVMLAVSLTLALGSAAFTQGDAPRVVFDNPIAGFSVTIPEDWDMGTGVLGDTVITVNTRTPSLLAPSLSFFYMRTSPKEGAEQVAGFLSAIGQGLGVNVTPQVRATGKSDEWEVTMTTSVPLVGELTGRWLCRRQEGATYVIGMIATSQAAEEFKDDIDTAFNTCHLINRQAIRYFREPTENGYRLMLPEDWKWEGSIYRDIDCPGWFVMKVQSPDGLTGCFESPPIQATTDYIGAQSLAESTFLQKLRKEVPDLELEAVHDMPRAGEVLAHAIGTETATTTQIQAQRAFADYVGTLNGTRIRIRVDICLYFAPFSFGGGSEAIWVRGAWAPVDKFESLYPIARGVQASLWETPEWRRNVRNTVTAVLKGRAGAMQESAEEWDRYMREVELVRDPAGGAPQEVPYGPGRVWKDTDGKMYRVPSLTDLESELDRRGWKPLQGDH